MNITDKTNFDYEINTYFIADKTYHSIASEISNGDLLTIYNAQIRQFLPYYFLTKGIFLNEAQAFGKYRVTKHSSQHPLLFSCKNDKNEIHYIEPFIEENRLIIERGTTYFNFFFAVTLNFYFNNPENVQFENFIEYQKVSNFGNDIEALRKFIIAILRKYSLSIFFGKHEIIYEEFESKFPPVVLTDDNKIKCDAAFIQFRKFISLLITDATEGINENDIEPFIRTNFKLRGKEKPFIKLKQNFKISCKKGCFTHVVAFFWLIIYSNKIIHSDEIRKVKMLLKNEFSIKDDTIEKIFGKKKFREKFLKTIPFIKIKIEINSIFS